MKSLTEVNLQHWNSILSLRPRTILISFGTIALSSEMPEEYKKSFLQAIRAFPDVTFVWKYEVNLLFLELRSMLSSNRCSDLNFINYRSESRPSRFQGNWESHRDHLRSSTRASQQVLILLLLTSRLHDSFAIVDLLQYPLLLNVWNSFIPLQKTPASRSSSLTADYPAPWRPWWRVF